MLESVRGLELRTQYEHSADERWKYRGSVFDVFRAEDAASAVAQPPRERAQQRVPLDALGQRLE